MNCPLCGESMDETGHCPNCGGAASLPAQEEKRRDDSTLRSGVGIFYENLAVSQAEAEQEHRPPRPARYSSGERKGIVFSVALLLAILGTQRLRSRCGGDSWGKRDHNGQPHLLDLFLCGDV